MSKEKKLTEAKIEAIKKSGLSDEAKKAGVMGAVLGVGSDSLINAMISAENSVANKKAEEEAPKQKDFADYTPVERQIAKMLTENTGVHMMDSGGFYGRAWQQNRKVKDFKSRPAVTVETYLSEKEKLEERRKRLEDRERLRA